MINQKIQEGNLPCLTGISQMELCTDRTNGRSIR